MSMKKKPHNARRDLIILLVLDVLFIAEVCWEWSWGRFTYPRMRPWSSGILMLLFLGDTLQRILRFQELTGHWPDLRKRDLGANDLEKEEKEV